MNPNGHYELDLSKHRQIAVDLLAHNQRIVKIAEKNKLFDRSKNGNKSCFRNERVQHCPQIIAPDWKLPQDGFLEFDFIYLYQSRDQAPLTPDQFQILYDGLKLSKLSTPHKIKVTFI